MSLKCLWNVLRKGFHHGNPPDKPPPGGYRSKLRAFTVDRVPVPPGRQCDVRLGIVK